MCLIRLLSMHSIISLVVEVASKLMLVTLVLSMHNSNLDVMIAGSSCRSQQTFMCCFYQQEA